MKQILFKCLILFLIVVLLAPNLTSCFINIKNTDDSGSSSMSTDRNDDYDSDTDSSFESNWGDYFDSDTDSSFESDWDDFFDSSWDDYDSDTDSSTDTSKNTDTSTDDNTSTPEAPSIGDSTSEDFSGIKDDFVGLEFVEININEIQINEIEFEELVIQKIEITEVEMVDIEVTTINDEFVYLAYQNFVSFYEPDFDVGKFLLHTGITVVLVAVTVGLSYVGGPVGTFFGAVLAAEVTDLVVGAAIDAAISGYKAIQEGGDLSYVLGHMLNGVVEGMAWSAFLAPLANVGDGIKALKAFKNLQKVPGMDNLTHKQFQKLMKNMPDLISHAAKNIPAEATDDVIKAAYKTFTKASAELTEDMFTYAIKNMDDIVGIIKKYNPFNTASDVVKAMKKAFFSKANVADDVATAVIRSLQNHTIKSLDDITDEAVKKAVTKNFGEFMSLFGKTVANDFLNNSIKASFGNDIFELFAKSMTSTTLYSNMIEKLGKTQVDKLLSSYDNLILLQAKYGTKNLNRLLNVKTLYSQMLKTNTGIPDSEIRDAIEGILNGTIKSLSDITNKQIVSNINSSREIVVSMIKNLGSGKRSSGIIDELVARKIAAHVKSGVVDEETLLKIVKGSLNKSEIINTYGAAVYNELVDKSLYSIGAFSMQATANKALTKEILQDSLLSKGVAQDVVEKIVSGQRISFWGMSDEAVNNIGNIVAEYYRSLDKQIYDNFVLELAQTRSKLVSDFVQDYISKGNTIRNFRYAGDIMEPAGEFADIIKAKYGDILMTESGSPIFDQFAIARIESNSLTGINAEDMNIANKLHHYNYVSIPGYTWHHLEDGKTMILIPTELHEAYRHTGGADFIREGLKEAIK